LNHAPRSVVAVLGAVAAAALLVACEKKTTTVETPMGTTSTTTTTTAASTPSMSSMSASASAMAGNAASATSGAMTTAADAIGDAAITAKVKTALLADPDVKGLQIEVDTKDGAVLLTGTADNESNATKAATLARGIEGVKSVENKVVKTAK
jgi:hyperosmotically inducible protein